MNEYYQGKTAWVTGSSRGLGRCIAEMLAEAGCNVVISGRNQTNLQSSGEGNSVDEAAAEIAEKYGVRCIAVCGELSDEDTVKRCLDEIHAKIGPVDYLVCAAGGGNIGTALKTSMPKDSASDFDLASVKAIFAHNLFSAMLCCRAVIPDMRAGGFGRIITVGSIAGCGGNKNGNDGFAAYSHLHFLQNRTNIIRSDIRRYRISAKLKVICMNIPFRSRCTLPLQIIFQQHKDTA